MLNEGGSSNGLADRDHADVNRQGLRPPIRATINWRTNEKAAYLCGVAAWGRVVNQAAKPDCTFFVQRFNYTGINAAAQETSGLWLGSTPGKPEVEPSPQRRARGLLGLTPELSGFGLKWLNYKVFGPGQNLDTGNAAHRLGFMQDGFFVHLGLVAHKAPQSHALQSL